MFKNLKPYSAVQPSDLPWLPVVPAHWQLVRAKDVLRPVDIRSTTGDETLLTVSSSRGVVPRSSASVTMFQAASYAGHKLCWPGDLVINSLWAWGRGLGVSQHHGIISTAYGVYRPRDTRSLNAGFLHELVRSEPFHWELQVRSKGVWISRLQLTDDGFLRAPLPLPPGEEQAAIVRYLTHAHHRIDQAIAAKRKLIRLLEEEKRVIINQAVTHGLDPNAPLKDSGVPWLGDIPEHWQLRKLRSLFMGQGSGTTPPEAEDYGSEVPWVMSGDLNDDVVTITKRCVTHAAVNRLSSLKVYPAGSLVVAMYGATIGKTGVTGTDAATNQACCVFHTPRPGVHVGFVQFGARTAKPGLLISAFGGGQPNVNADIVRQLRIPVPPEDEQRRIVDHISRTSAHLQIAMARAKDEITLLHEVRSRLTADVVTGQVDVRAIAASLPDVSLDDLAGSMDGSMDDELDEFAEEFVEDAALL